MKATTQKTKHPKRLRIDWYPYQRRWVEDNSRFKLACKARQIGFTFAAAWRVVRKRIRVPGLTLWISASERQALEAMEHIRHHVAALEAVAAYEEDFLEGSLLKQQTVRLRNGSRIVALPANPDTVRGFAGDVVLDEFAFHRDADAIWRAAFATATRGFQLEIISTPNGARGKYYELAKAAGLVDRDPWLATRDPRESAPATPVTGHQSPVTVFSPHWVDLHSARTQGFVVDVESLRAAIGDEDAWQQEYCCRFLADAAHYLPPELVVAAEHPRAATTFLLPATSAQRPAISEGLRQGTALAVPNSVLREAQPGKGSGENLLGFPQRVRGSLYLGVDIGRRRDLTVLWLLEAEDTPTAVYWTRGLLALDRQPFAAQRQALDALLALRFSDERGLRGETFLQKGSPRTPSQDPGNASDPRVGSDAFRQKVLEERENPFAKGFSQGSGYVVKRCAIDATGLGAMLAEELQTKWGARVEPVVFTQAVKEALAVRVKRLLEEGRLRLPADPAVRAALGAVKRYVTPAGHFRFDAERTEASGHADHFWALALALAAAEEPEISLEFVSSALLRPWAQAAAF